MRHRNNLLVLVAIALVSVVVMAADNANCPMSTRPANPETTLEWEGKTVAFCCGGCRARFEKLDTKDQHTKFDAVAGSAPKATPETGTPASSAEEMTLTRYYLLPTCPVSGKPIATTPPATSKVIDGRQISFCCPSCIERFEAEPAKYNAKIDEQIVKRQRPSYPLTTCLASGRPVDVKGTPTDSVAGNQLMRFCCGGCAKYVTDDPARFKVALKKLDEAYIKQQLPTYPLQICVVSGEPLDDKSVNTVVGGQLVRLCCTHCEKKFNSKPQAYLGMVEAARKQDKPAG
ncbi:MAG: hypothetical protein MK116_05425 [Phycisphaerales bacterium]|nr:hypothetical protein [Phycisphaerales bacterium]